MSLELHKQIRLHRYQIAISNLKVQEYLPPRLALIVALYEVCQKLERKTFREEEVLEYWREKLLPVLHQPGYKRLFRGMLEEGYIEETGKGWYKPTDLAAWALREQKPWRSEAGIYEVWRWEGDEDLRKKLGLSPNPLLVLIRPNPNTESQGQDYSKRDLLKELKNKESYYLDLIQGDKAFAPIKAFLVEATEPIRFLNKEPARLVIREGVPYAVYIEVDMPADSGKKQPLSLEFRLPSDQEALWEKSLTQHILQENHRETYDAEHNAILVPFDERNTALKGTYKIEKPRFRRIQFDNSAIELPVRRLPSTPNDAQKWVIALLAEGLGEYLHTDEKFLQKARDMAQPIYEKYPALSLPERKDIAKQWFQKGHYRKAYYLFAALDLSL